MGHDWDALPEECHNCFWWLGKTVYSDNTSRRVLVFYDESSISEQPSCAPQRATAAEQNLPLHTANLIVIIPRQLRTRLDAPGKERTE